ncbi:hypothetical protein GCM10027073_01170 [Streptomyces chlorus]
MQHRPDPAALALVSERVGQGPGRGLGHPECREYVVVLYVRMHGARGSVAAGDAGNDYYRGTAAAAAVRQTREGPTWSLYI